MKPVYPVGATWIWNSKDGRLTVKIFIEHRWVCKDTIHETWRWITSEWDDEKIITKTGTEDSYKLCRSQIPYDCVMRRIL